eukprot:g31594.t1
MCEQLNKRTKEFLQDLAKQSATVAATDAQESEGDDFVPSSQLAEQESTQPLGSLFGLPAREPSEHEEEDEEAFNDLVRRASLNAKSSADAVLTPPKRTLTQDMETQDPNQESPASKASEDSRSIFSQPTRSSTGTPVVQPADRRKASLPLTPVNPLKPFPPCTSSSSSSSPSSSSSSSSSPSLQASTPLPNLKRKQPPASSRSSDPEEISVPSKKNKKMKGKKSLGKNVSQKEKVAKEEEKYREDTKALVEEATSTVSGLTYSRVEVLPDIIAEAPHKGVKDRELDNEHVLQLMKNFCTSQNPNDKIEWVGWMCDKSDKVGYTEDLGLGEEDDELLVLPRFCKKEVVQEFVD